MTKGIYRDSPGIIPEGYGKYNKNIVVNKQGLFVTNEYGFTEAFTLDGLFLGKIETNNEVVLFYVEDAEVDPESYIYLFRNDVLNLVVKGTEFNFHKDNPIEGVYQYTQNNDLIIAWWDGITSTANTPKLLNVDCLPFELDAQKGLLNSSDINLVELFPLFTSPNIQVIEERINTGVLESGAYNIFVYYELQDGDKLGYNFVGNTYYLFGSGLEIYNEIQGQDGGIVTTKSLRVRLIDVNTIFSKIGIGVAHTSNGATRFYDYGSQAISGTTVDFIINGGFELEVTLEEISNYRAYYEKVEAGTVINNRLYLGNFKNSDTVDLQSIFNATTVKWVYEEAEAINLEKVLRSSKDSETMFFTKTFLPDEVYALYAKVAYKNGNIVVYPIPGRQARTGITWNNYSDETYSAGGSSSNLIINERDNLQSIVDAARLAAPGNNINNLEQALNIGSDVKAFHILDTAASDGTMGYWEQELETYPECFPDYGGEKVRYHKMPSLEALKQWLDDAGDDDIFFRKGTIKGDLLNTISLEDDTISDNYEGSARGRIYDFEKISETGSATGTMVQYNLLDLAADPGIPDYNSTNPGDIFYENAYQPYDNQVIDVLVNWERHVDWGVVLDVKIAILDSLGNIVSIEYDTNETFPLDVDGNVSFYDTRLYENISIQGGQILAIIISEAGPLYGHTVAQRGRVTLDIQVHEDLSAGSNVYARPLGIKIENINIPVAEREKIDHIELCYAKRGDFNSLVKGMSILTEPNTTGHEVTSYSGTVRFHSFEMLKDKVSLMNYMKTHFKGIPTESALANGTFFEGVDEDIDAESYRGLRTILNRFYIPENVIGSIDNTQREEALILNITGILDDVLDSPDNRIVFATIFAHLTEVYDGLYQNTLVRSGTKIAPNLTQLKSYGGDSFITPYAFKYHTDTDLHVYHFPVYSRVNIALREEGDEEGQLVYPFTSDPTDYTVTDGNVLDVGNYIAYNADFNKLLDYEGLNAYINRCEDSCADREVTAYPYRIHRSIAYGNESNIIRWRNFLLDDYYEMPRTRGMITNLEAFNNSLLIHTEFSLFAAVNKDEFRTDALTIALGNSDIFTTTPDEIIFGKDDYLGCTNKFATYIHRNMYMFLNSARGKVFVLMPNDIKEVSLNGMYAWCRDNLIDSGKNPYTGSGVVIGYDNFHERFMLTKVVRDSGEMDIVNSKTFSIYPRIDKLEYVWLSEHDYAPSSYWQISRNVYCIEQKEDGYTLFLMNDISKFGDYGDGVKESYLEVAIHRRDTENWKQLIWTLISNNNAGNVYEDNFDYVHIRNDYQGTNKLELIEEGLTKLNINTRKVNGYYLFNEFKDQKNQTDISLLDTHGNIIAGALNNNSFVGKKKFNSPYIIVRLYYDNNKGNSFFLIDIKAE